MTEVKIGKNEHLDQYETAMANGYSEGQAAGLAMWPQKDFVIFINEMIRGDDNPKIWVFKQEDGTTKIKTAPNPTSKLYHSEENPPDNEHYDGVRLCPICKRTYVTCSSDMEAHKRYCNAPDRLGWNKSTYNVNDQWTFAEHDQELCRHIQQAGGKLQLGQYTYSISANGKYIKRRLLVPR